MKPEDVWSESISRSELKNIGIELSDTEWLSLQDELDEALAEVWAQLRWRFDV